MAAIFQNTFQTTEEALQKLQSSSKAKERAWVDNVANWRCGIESPLRQTTKLRAYAAAQPC